MNSTTTTTLKEISSQDMCLSAEHYVTKKCAYHHKDELRREELSRMIVSRKEDIRSMRKEIRLINKKLEE